MTELDPLKGRQEGTQRETSLQIMMELDPLKGGKKGDKASNHEGTGSSRRETRINAIRRETKMETKGDKVSNHDGTNSFASNELRHGPRMGPTYPSK